MNALTNALKSVHDLEASIGMSLAEVEAKTTAKTRLDRASAPFKVVAAAWAGGVMLGGEHCDDPAYVRLVSTVSDAGDIPDDLFGEPRLLGMIARGLDVEVPTERLRLLELVASAACVPALPYELVFPEVFFPHGKMGLRAGFDAVLGNPPWDAIQPKSKEFFASFDFEILNAPTKRERSEIEHHLLAEPTVAALFETYTESFEEQKRLNDVLYHYQKVQIEGDLAGRQLDSFRVFMERNAQLLGQKGATGAVVPSAFHANAGATGVRRLYLDEMALRCCYSLENRRKLFEIDSRFKFALVVASYPGPTTQFPCAFYLHEAEWLFRDRDDRELHYSLDFVRKTSGQYLSLVELRAAADMECALHMFASGTLFGQWTSAVGISIQESPAALHISHEGWRFVATNRYFPREVDPRRSPPAEISKSQNLLTLHEGKTFRDFDDAWGERNRWMIPMQQILDLPRHIARARGYQFALRKISRSTDERTIISCLLPPGVAVTYSALVDAGIQTTQIP